jgi:integrase
MAQGADLLSDPDVRRWYENLAEGSHRTAVEYLSWLKQYCDYVGQTPKELVLAFGQDKKLAQDSLEDWISSLRHRGMMPKTINNALSAAKSWLRRNEVEITRQIIIKNVHDTPTIENERVPTKEELKRVLDHADIRAKVILALIALCGLRFETMSKLTLKDLIELHIDGHEVAVDNPTMQIRIPGSASKNKRPYFVFLPTQATEWVREYLKLRLRRGERLKADTPLLVAGQRTFSHGRWLNAGDPLTRQAIAHDLRKVMRKAGLTQRPYVWKSYFDLALQTAKIQHVREQFYLGHAGPMEAQYGIHKQLPPNVLEDMRKEFAEKVEPVLIGPSSVITENDVKEVALSVLSELINPEGYKTLSTIGISEADFRAIRDAIAGEKATKQKVVTAEDAEKLVEEGWVWRGNLPNGRVVMERS